MSGVSAALRDGRGRAVKTFLIFMASLSTGVLFALPRRALVLAALIAAAGHSWKEWLLWYGASSPEAAFLGALLVATAAEVMARIMKLPSPVLAIPGIIPLVPGSAAYRAITHVVQGREVLGAETAVSAGMVAVAIASGLLLASALSRRLMGPVFVLAVEGVFQPWDLGEESGEETT